MGWMRTLLLGDVGNRLDIGDNERRIREMRQLMRRNRSSKRATDRTQDQAITGLQAEVDDLKIALSSLGPLLVGKGVIQQAEWHALIDAIDERDPS